MKRAVLLAHRGVALEAAADDLVSRAAGSRLALEVALHHLRQHLPLSFGPGHTSLAHTGADASLRLAIMRLARGETAGSSASGLPHDDEGARRMVDTRLAH